MNGKVVDPQVENYLYNWGVLESSGLMVEEEENMLGKWPPFLLVSNKIGKIGKTNVPI